MISVFLSAIMLPILLILSLICESARVAYEKSVISSSMYISAYSALASYCKELYDDFGIFSIYDTEAGLNNTCNTYLKSNLLMDNAPLIGFHTFSKPKSLSTSIKDVIHLTDQDGRIFAQSIIEYTKDSIPSDVIDLFARTYTPLTGDASGRAYVPDINSTLTEQQDNGMEHIPSVQSAKEIIDSIPADSDNTSEDTYVKLSDKIGNIITNQLLSFVIDNPSNISTLTIDPMTVPSNTIALSDKAKEEKELRFISIDTPADKLIDDGLDKLCFVKYIDEHFLCYTDYLDSKHSADKEPLCYQLEYIIGHSDSDKTNLLQTLTDLVTFRSGINFIYILTDYEKVSAAKNAASLMAAAIPIPGIEFIITYGILSIWSTAEAIVDCRDLCYGLKVPLLKTSASWNLSLANAMNLSKNSPSKNDGREGLTYKEYLLIMLMLYNNTSLFINTMDLIQLYITKNYLPEFRLESCISSFTLNATIQNAPVFLSPKGFLTSSYTYNNSLRAAY